MLCPNIVMIQATSLVNSELNHLFGTWREADLTKDNTIATANNKSNGTANFVKLHTEICKYFCSDPFAASDQPEEEMFCSDIVVLEALRLFLSETQDLSGLLCELIKPISVVHLFVTPLSLAEGGTEPSVSLR
jgi:hypothetical protein